MPCCSGRPPPAELPGAETSTRWPGCASTMPPRPAALVDVAGGGAWADRAVVAHPTVVWALVGEGSGDPALPAAAATAAGSEGDGEGAPLVVVSGEDRIRRLQTAVSAAAGSMFL